MGSSNSPYREISHFCWKLSFALKKQTCQPSHQNHQQQILWTMSESHSFSATSVYCVSCVSAYFLLVMFNNQRIVCSKLYQSDYLLDSSLWRTYKVRYFYIFPPVFERLHFQSNNNKINEKYKIQACASWQCFTWVVYCTLSFTTLGQGQSSIRHVHRRRRLQQSSFAVVEGSYSQTSSTQQIHEPIALPAERIRRTLLCWC